jgi:hypothetical protein
MSFLSKEQILAAKDLEYEDVEISEWGGTVRIRGMSAADRDEIESLYFSTDDGKPKDMRLLRSRILVLSLVDENDQRLFKFEEASALAKKSAVVIDHIFPIAQRLSKMSKEDVEEIAGNSSSGQESGSTTDSAWPSEEDSLIRTNS